MIKINFRKISFLSSSLILLLSSCSKNFKDDDFTAYFGGEVTNPRNTYVLLYKDSKLIDTLELNKENRFFVKFDSLTPGLYTFKHEPEYQYVYFDKNDSIMVHINANDFDESIIFCGRGEEKNNFLMELYLKNEQDKESMYDVVKYEPAQFIKTIDTAQEAREKFYKTKKEELKWGADFDIYAKATLDLYNYSKKEIYPEAHFITTREDITSKLPENFYDYRKGVNFNNPELTNFSPFVRYLSVMLDNIASKDNFSKHLSSDTALEKNIKKLNIADTLFKNDKVKNTVLNNIAFLYLLEDQHIINNQKFLERFYQLSTDTNQQNEIRKIGDATQLLKVGNRLPEVKLNNTDDLPISQADLLNKKTVIFFWTSKAESHFEAAHKKVKALKLKYPNTQFVAVNIEDSYADWKKILAKYQFDGITELRAPNFEDLKDKWVITKIHRTMVTNADGTIENAFTNLFDVKFEDNLK
ncbi:TlpA family protein disulfide reductase [Flavobacterium sp. '19STA2R22 D10 B1']|uniref:TlpA family protein disulfide reductase n=1 Tax=Flavobacterium aerium TaxID=3037261 RepID=UPI00278BB9B5|nr:thioredoxin-like domain-containing protein [Flavobacterium sp. '19STA2R22 D10 B1']